MATSLGSVTGRARYDGVVATGEPAAAIPWFLYAVAAAASFVTVGVIWDISWHMTIGRDTFWTPAHLCTYTAALIVGVTCGWVALKTTFAGTPEEKATAVRFWGFRAPLGAWISVWGAFAMLTSAPFDNWWHNAYGLDVKIISPPHTLLALGMVAIVIGALVWTLACQNRADAADRRRLELLFVYAAGLLLVMAGIYVSEFSYRGFQHGSQFYRVTSLAFPMLLIAIARGSTMRWPATTMALVYMATFMVMGWILPLFPAQPKLGPIFMPLDRMQAMEFPLLLIAPAFCFDLLTHRFGKARSSMRDWALAPLFGFVFVTAFVAAQWPFADFLHSAAARNWFFFADRNFTYGVRPASAYGQYRYFPIALESGAALAKGLALAVVYATLSSRLGMAWGRWMTTVKR
jgi:hypothetical protein